MGEFDYRQYSRESSARGAQVKAIPDVVDKDRREYCRADLSEFLRVYFPETTGLKPFCPEQLEAIKRLELGILHGGSRVLNLFPRGFAKTTISENAAIWATAYGHRRFVPIIGADENAAKDNIESIKTEWLTNDRLHEDFPEIAEFIRALENKSQRARSQTGPDGELTHIQWGMDTLVLPSVRMPDGQWTAGSGGILTARGLTGRLRGMGHKRPDGTKQRPDFVIIDDPQTDVSAMSPAQCQKRLSLIQKSVLRLGGHQRQLAACMNATCIIEDDAVDQLADHQKHPEWEGMRIPMLKSESDVHESEWLGTYADLRRNYNQEDPHDRRRAIRDSNKYYRENREKMDEGAAATWEHCYSMEDADPELSAIQHAYNILIDDGPEVFASECQNQPLRLHGISEFLSAGEINGTRVGAWDRTAMPNDVEHVGFHIDVQKRLLYWTIVGVTSDWSIKAIYGTYPEQKRKGFLYRDVTRTLQRVHKGVSEERAITLSVAALVADLMERGVTREDGVKIRPQFGLVDGGYQTSAVREGIKQSGHNRSVFVTFGRGVKAGDVPFSQRRVSKGEKRSTDVAIPWQLKPDNTLKGERNVFVDTNAAKTFLHRRILVDAGRAGSFELPKGEHRHFAEHLASSEYATPTEGPYGQVIEWKLLPGNPDNHWLDTTANALVAVSMTGAVVFNQARPAKRSGAKRKRRVSYL